MRGHGWAWVTLLVAALGCGDAADPRMDAGRPDVERNYGRDAVRCGDGVLDRGEACDGTVLAQSCESLGLQPGPLSCSEDCTLDRSLCGTRPTPPDGGNVVPIPDAGPVKPRAKAACDLILSCGDIPVATEEDGIFASFGARNSREFCERNVDATCLACTFAALNSDLDAGGGGCEQNCRSACWSLTTLPQIDRLLEPDLCEVTAAELVPPFDHACLCAQCLGPLRGCLSNSLCIDALLCIEATGCQGNACTELDVCRGPIRALAFSSSTAVLDELRTCIADNHCSAP